MDQACCITALRQWCKGTESAGSLLRSNCQFGEVVFCLLFSTFFSWSPCKVGLGMRRQFQPCAEFLSLAVIGWSSPRTLMILQSFCPKISLCLFFFSQSLLSQISPPFASSLFSFWSTPLLFFLPVSHLPDLSLSFSFSPTSSIFILIIHFINPNHNLTFCFCMISVALLLFLRVARFVSGL